MKRLTAKPNTSYIIGIDEVGRGPLAGPVVVCAVAIPSTLRPISIAPKVPLRPSTGSGSRASLSDDRLALRDSKKLTALQRTAWATAIKTDPRISYSIAAVSPPVIDHINVTQAANRAATRALTKVLSTLPSPCHVTLFLDGGIFILETRKVKYEKQGKPSSTLSYTDTEKHFQFSAMTVVKGDEKIPAISFASIVAKQHRDALMHRAHKKYPQYGFDRHVGYGTKKHILALKKNGSSPLHRKSFLRKIV